MDVRVRDTDKRPRMCADGGHTEQARYKARQCAVLGLGAAPYTLVHVGTLATSRAAAKRAPRETETGCVVSAHTSEALSMYEYARVILCTCVLVAVMHAVYYESLR